MSPTFPCGPMSFCTWSLIVLQPYYLWFSYLSTPQNPIVLFISYCLSHVPLYLQCSCCAFHVPSYFQCFHCSSSVTLYLQGSFPQCSILTSCFTVPNFALTTIVLQCSIELHCYILLHHSTVLHRSHCAPKYHCSPASTVVWILILHLSHTYRSSLSTSNVSRHFCRVHQHSHC